MTLAEAQKAVAAILKDLESSTGTIVSGIQLERLDVTGLNDDFPCHLMTVAIETERLPGHEWDC